MRGDGCDDVCGHNVVCSLDVRARGELEAIAKLQVLHVNSLTLVVVMMHLNRLNSRYMHECVSS